MRTQTLRASQWCWWWASTRQERQLSSGKIVASHSSAIQKDADSLHFVHVINPGLEQRMMTVALYVLCVFRYLIEQDFPGSRVGPEPTTDCFSAVMYGDVEGIIPGNALTVDPKKPFRNLGPFGNSFLNRWLKKTQKQIMEKGKRKGSSITSQIFFRCRFQCVQMPNEVLESISIIDTPGILTAAKRKLSRGEILY